ncbi:hypothetical protein QR680_013815 [Steinernema hermaphroditum]|uniref:F-box domain-containing protein n=1 Tax=Steinernema hermaphroditum TaxID=289476 RepID=A0AA39M351_9BILA|nr:hypothetical protein QR680_013815 [Steinernema hermaphroditum]
MDDLPGDLIEQIVQQTRFEAVKLMSKIDSDSFWVTEATHHVQRRSELLIEIDLKPNNDVGAVDYKLTREDTHATTNYLQRPTFTMRNESKFVELIRVQLKGEERLPFSSGGGEVEDFSGDEYTEDRITDSPEFQEDAIDDYEDQDSEDWQELYDRWRNDNGEDSDDDEYEDDYYDSDDDPYSDVIAVHPATPPPRINVNEKGLRQSLALMALRDMTIFKESTLVIDSLSEKLYPCVGSLIDLLSGNFAHVTLHNLLGFGGHISALLNRCLAMKCTRHLYINNVDIAALNPDLVVSLIKMGSLVTFYYFPRDRSHVPLLDVGRIVDIANWWTSEGGKNGNLNQIDMYCSRANWRLIRAQLENEGAERKYRSLFEVIGEKGNITCQLKEGMLLMVFHKL